MKCGFAKANINPPVGARMMGFSRRDVEKGCTAIHDDIFVRAAYIEENNDTVIILGYDLCMLGRIESGKIKEAVFGKLSIPPDKILMNYSHTHSSPFTGECNLAWNTFKRDDAYMDKILHSTIDAALEAKKTAVQVKLYAGETKSSLPMNRRRKDENGVIQFSPNPGGVVYDSLPICEFKDLNGKTVCLLFSVACHPSSISGFEISAEYPGAAMNMIDDHLGNPASIFLQGAGGDAKASVIGNGQRWRKATWEDITSSGKLVADAVVSKLKAGLIEVKPCLKSKLLDIPFPLQKHITKEEYTKIINDNTSEDIKKSWAKTMVQKLNNNEKLPDNAPIFIQGIELGEALRIIAIEGEPVAELSLLIKDYYKPGVTFPLGFSNGEGMYLTTSKMLDEGGYEADCYWEYCFPSPLAKGVENILLKALSIFPLSS